MKKKGEFCPEKRKKRWELVKVRLCKMKQVRSFLSVNLDSEHAKGVTKGIQIFNIYIYLIQCTWKIWHDGVNQSWKNSNLKKKIRYFIKSLFSAYFITKRYTNELYYFFMFIYVTVMIVFGPYTLSSLCRLNLFKPLFWDTPAALVVSIN